MGCQQAVNVLCNTGHFILFVLVLEKRPKTELSDQQVEAAMQDVSGWTTEQAESRQTRTNPRYQLIGLGQTVSIY